jgi:hypothetical protein
VVFRSDTYTDTEVIPHLLSLKLAWIVTTGGVSGAARSSSVDTPSLLSNSEISLHVADKRSFRHLMLKEIHEHPETAALFVPRLLPEATGGSGTLMVLPLDDDFNAGGRADPGAGLRHQLLSANTLMRGITQSG